MAITFDIPADLSEVFRFNAGQYLTLRQLVNDEDLRRSYSVCTAPSEDSLTVAIKKIAGGKFSSFANDLLRKGDSLKVMPPTGNFTFDPSEGADYVFFAAGSGITPIISHIKNILFSTSTATATLFLGNKNFESIIFRDELDALKNKYLERLAVHHIFTKEKIGIDLMYGRIDKAKCIGLSKTLFDALSSDAIMLCGPNQMIFDVKEALEEIGVPKEKIHFELFNTDGLKKSDSPMLVLSDSEKTKESDICIQMDGDIFEFSLEYSGQNLLDAAIANGADLPYSCKGGVCSTCKAKITEGEVVMELNYALEAEEVNAGYVLLCQAHPRSPKIYIDFDQK